MIYIDEKGKTNVLVRTTRKRKYDEIEDDKRDAWEKKFEQETKSYKEEILFLKNQMKELDILKLQNEEAHIKLQELYEAGIIDSNFEPTNNMA